jgi:hypothetical protein
LRFLDLGGVERCGRADLGYRRVAGIEQINGDACGCSNQNKGAGADEQRADFPADRFA